MKLDSVTLIHDAMFEGQSSSFYSKSKGFNVESDGAWVTILRGPTTITVPVANVKFGALPSKLVTLAGRVTEKDWEPVSKDPLIGEKPLPPTSGAKAPLTQSEKMKLYWEKRRKADALASIAAEAKMAPPTKNETGAV